MSHFTSLLLGCVLTLVSVDALYSRRIDDVITPTCPCASPAWCKTPTGSVRNEVFIFVLSEVNFALYDWSKVTTVVQFMAINDSLTCYAHSKGARSVYAANFPAANLTNEADRTRWVKQKVSFARDHFLDGINVDFESEIDRNDTARRSGLTSLMRQLAAAFRASFHRPQITLDVAWSPDCIDKRCFDYAAIAAITDFIFIMSYDERSQIYGDCVAFANSAANTTIHGVERYLSLGISPRKLVLGIPWYGYSYPCITLDKNNTCSIKKVPFRGVECSDAAGSQINYSSIVADFLPAASTGPQWNLPAQSPYFNWKDPTSGVLRQIWYDNPRSLTYKYNYAASRGLLGVGMWNADAIDYSDTPAGDQQRREMWGAIPYTNTRHH